MRTDSKERVTQQILKVNHAGEHGAIAIYRAQIAQLADREPELAAWLRETLAHEIRHRESFKSVMAERAVSPCGALAVWSIGGSVLGRSMALFGPFGVLICTAAVERTVHRHLQEQVAFLSGYDDALANLILEIQKEENEHLEYAEARHDPEGHLARMLSAFVAGATALLILASTQGSSLGLSRRMRAGRASTPS
jgi:ubiquinone biosynthesis monooxygenase Coq7